MSSNRSSRRRTSTAPDLAPTDHTLRDGGSRVGRLVRLVRLVKVGRADAWPCVQHLRARRVPSPGFDGEGLRVRHADVCLWCTSYTSERLVSDKKTLRVGGRTYWCGSHKTGKEAQVTPSRDG
jgi:hypothetical protein